jgi:hypothetical protein
MPYLEVPVLFLISLILRLYFINNIKNSDEWASFFFISMQNRKWINYEQDKSIPSGYNASPKFYFYIIKKIFKKNNYKKGTILNILFDCFLVLTFYVYISFYFELSFQYLSFFSDQFLFSVLLLSVPIYLPTNARLIGVKARTFGNYLNMIYFLVLINMGHNLILELIILFILFEIILLSSIFAAQNVIFISIIYSILTKNFLILIPFAISLMSAFIYDYGKIKLLKHKLNHFIWYFKFINNTQLRYKNSINSFIDIIKRENKVKIINHLFRHSSFFILIINFGLVYCYFIKIDFYRYDFSEFNQFYINNEKIIYIVLSTLMIFLITSFGKFKIFGQAERYFEYAAPFIYILFFSIWFQNNDSYLVILILISNLCIIFINKFLNKQKTFPDGKKVILFIKKLIKSNKVNLLCIPVKYSFNLAARIESKNIKYYMNFITPAKNGFKYMIEDLDYYNLPKSNLFRMKKKYNINYVLIENKKKLKKKYIKYIKKIVYKDNSFIIINI